MYAIRLGFVTVTAEGVLRGYITSGSLLSLIQCLNPGKFSRVGGGDRWVLMEDRQPQYVETASSFN